MSYMTLFRLFSQIKDEPESFGSKYQILLYFIDTVSDDHKVIYSS